MTCLVSVVIPTFNAASFIGEALQSVRAQAYRPLEVIVVDDGSTDNTEAVVRSAAEQTGEAFEVRYLRQKNGGPSSARNTGIKAAHGDFIALLDADDQWCELKLKRQMELFMLNPHLDLVFCNVRFIVDGKSSGILFGEDGTRTSFMHNQGVVLDAVVSLLRDNFVNTSAVVLRKECFKSGFLFDENRRFAEDWDLWLKLSTRFRLGYVPEVGTHEFQRVGSLSSNGTEMMLSGIEVVENFLKDYFSVTDVNEIVEPIYRTILFDTYKWAGYRLMRGGNSQKSREMFLKALRLRIDIKTIVYYLMSFYILVKSKGTYEDKNY